LAENYLNLAEAYNEAGNPTKALEYLKFVRDRAGIPNATQTDKDLLRKTIQREWAVEFFEESHRLYDIKHWKIAAEILGAPRDRFVYSFVNAAGPNDVETDFKKYWKASYAKGFWSPSQYLVPFPAKEINKGYLVQNPGY
jgi:tetratricopeptide (TPR) repeat protein